MGDGKDGSDLGGRILFLSGALRMPLTYGLDSARRLRGFLRVCGSATWALRDGFGLAFSPVAVWFSSVALWSKTVEFEEVVEVTVWFVNSGVSGLDGASGVSGANDERREPVSDPEAEDFRDGWEEVVGFGCSGVSGVSGGSSKTRSGVEEGMRFRRGGELLEARGRLDRDGLEAA